MTRLFDAASYFTRRQSDARYLFRPQPAQPPTGLAFVATGLYSLPTDPPGPSPNAFVSLTLIPPGNPYWSTAPQYVAAFQFTAVPVSGPTLTFTLAYAGVGPYQLAPLGAGTQYSVTAQTVDYLQQTSIASDALVVVTQASVTAPAARTIVAQAVPTGCQITLDALNSEIDFSHYELYRGQGNLAALRVMSFTNAQAPLGVVVDTAIPVTASDYYYFLRSYNNSGNYGQSNTVASLSLVSTATPPVIQPDLVGPPRAAAIANDDGTISFTFLSNTSDTSPHLTGYRIFRRVTGTTFWQAWDAISAVPATPLSGTLTTYIDTRAVSGVSYDYTVAATDDFGNQSSFDANNFVSATALDITGPDAPTSMLFAGVPGGIQVSWTASVASDVASYEVSWRFAQSAVDPRLTSWSDPVLTLASPFIIQGIVGPTTGLGIDASLLANLFEVRVRALDVTSNFSGYLDAIVTFPDLTNYSAVGLLQPPSPLLVHPVVVSDPGIGNDGTVTLTWLAPAGAGIAGYLVEGQIDQGSWSLLAVINDPLTGTKTYVVAGLAPFAVTNSTYRFRVRSFSTDGGTSNYNYLVNPGFEEDFSSWAVSIGSITQTTYNNSVGAALVSNNSGLHQEVMGIIPGHAYTLSAFLRESPASPGGFANLRIDWRDAGNVIISTSVLPLLVHASSLFIRYSLTSTAPAGAVTATIWLLGSTLAPNVSVIWDAAQFEEDSVPTLYADGKTAFLPVVDTTGPPDYLTLGFVGVGGLGQINLRWNNPPSSQFDYHLSIFEVWRNQISADPGYPAWFKVAEIAGENNGLANGYNDYDPDPEINSTWNYQLRARDQWGNIGAFLRGGALSTVVQATSLTPNDQGISTGDTIPPADPNMITASIQVDDDGSITIQWDNQITLDLSGYNVYRRRHQDTQFISVAMFKSSPGTGRVFWTDSNPVLLTQYDYTVSAFDRAGNESGKDTVHFLTGISTDTRVPGVPTNPIGKGAVGQIICNWGPSSTVGIHDYNFQFSLDNGSTWSTAIVVTGTTYTQNFFAAEDVSLMKFRVSALSSTHSAASVYVVDTSIDTSTYVPVDGGPPQPITFLVGTPNTNSQVVLTWIRSVSLDVNHYQIDMAIQPDPTILPGSIDWSFFQNTASNSTGVSLNGLKPYLLSGLSYAFRVWSVDNSGLLSTTAPEVDTVQVLVDSSPPAIPAGFNGYMAADPFPSPSVHAILAWSANTEVDLLQYEVQYYVSDSVGNPLEPINIIPIAKDSPGAYIPGLFPTPKVYAASVRAVDINQNRSPFTDPIFLQSTSSVAFVPDNQPGVAAGWNGTHPVITIGTLGAPGTAYSPSIYFLYFQVHRAQMHTVASANRTTDGANPANGQGHIVFTTIHNFSVGQTALLQSFTGHPNFNGLWTIVSVPSNTQIVVEMPGLPAPVSTFLNEGHGAGEGLVLVNTGSTSYVDTSVGHTSAGTTFVYSARAFNNGGFLSAASNPFGVLTIP